MVEFTPAGKRKRRKYPVKSTDPADRNPTGNVRRSSAGTRRRKARKA